MSFIVEGVQNGCQAVYTNVVKPTHDTVSTVWNGAVVDTGLWIGSGFKKVTDDHLPKPVAIIAQKLFSSIPVAVGYFVLPLPYRAGIWAAYTLVNLTLSWKYPVTDEALGFAMIGESARALAWYLGAKEVIDIVACVVTAFASVYYLHRANS